LSLTVYIIYSRDKYYLHAHTFQAKGCIHLFSRCSWQLYGIRQQNILSDLLIPRNGVKTCHHMRLQTHISTINSYVLQFHKRFIDSNAADWIRLRKNPGSVWSRVSCSSKPQV